MSLDHTLALQISLDSGCERTVSGRARRLLVDPDRIRHVLKEKIGKIAAKVEPFG